MLSLFLGRFGWVVVVCHGVFLLISKAEIVLGLIGCRAAR